MSEPAAHGAPAAPASPGALFRAFTRLALQGFGGVLPVAQRELVERLRWLDREDFMALLSLAQVLPGPNIVNLALMIGDRHFGARGAAGLILATVWRLARTLRGNIRAPCGAAGRGMNGLGIGGLDLLALFTHFLVLSLLAVGGAMTTAPDMQRYLVHQQGWLSDMQFTASVALAQAAPGPNVLFVAVLGFQVAGLAGVVATLGGTLLPSTVLALAAARWSVRHAESAALRAFTAGMAPLTLGLLLATAVVLLQPVGLNLPAGLLLAATVAWMLGTRRSPLWPMAVGALAGAVGWV